jgi:hypothetical protein
MLEQFSFYLVLGTLLFLGVVCGLLFIAYRQRQARRSAPPKLWGLNETDDFLRSRALPPASRHRLIATIGYADGSKLVTRN